MDLIDKLRQAAEETNNSLFLEAQEAIINLVIAVKTSQIALDDWLNIHAPEFCSDLRVAEAYRRLGEHGTISYIAEVQVVNRLALANATRKIIDMSADFKVDNPEDVWFSESPGAHRNE